MGNFCFRSTAAQSRRAAGAQAAQRTHRKHSAAPTRRASSPSQRRGAAEASKMPCCGPAGRSRTRRARSEGRTGFAPCRQLEEPIRAVGSGRGDRGRVESAGPAPKWKPHPAAPNSAFSREPNPTKPERIPTCTPNELHRRSSEPRFEPVRTLGSIGSNTVRTHFSNGSNPISTRFCHWNHLEPWVLIRFEPVRTRWSRSETCALNRVRTV